MLKNFLIATLIIITTNLFAQVGTIDGVITDQKTGEAVIGAVVQIEALRVGAVSGIDGKFVITDLAAGNYQLKISFIAYETIELDVRVIAGRAVSLNIAMSERDNMLGEVVVQGARRMNNEISMIHIQRTALTLVSNISSQQITRTQDRDASEVIKRIPGISIIDNRFIIARGLSQRYNNVWINNNAVPSTEADSRAFSFDMIPSGQIENMMIIKTPAPELPADFSGGFVKINTKSITEENSLQLSYGININTQTHFRDFKYAKGSPTDFLGYDNGFRGLRSAVPAQRMDNRDAELVTNVTANGFNNNWEIQTRKPFADHRFSVMLNRFAKLDNGSRLGAVAAFNYSYSYLAYQDMVNARFGIYNRLADESVYTYKYNDDQYTISSRIGGMVNLTWMLSNKHRLEVRNIFNQQGRNRYTYRDGWQFASGEYEQEKEEYFYNSRGAYTGQLSGIHNFSSTSELDWTIGFSTANNNRPDRREMNRDKSTSPENKFEFKTLQRDFIQLDENIYSAGLNHSLVFSLGAIAPTLKIGAYVEHSLRNYNTRRFIYDFFRTNVPQGFGAWSLAEMMNPQYLAANMLFVNDATDMTYNYSGENTLMSGYMGLNIPIGRFNVYAGVRYENNLMTLNNNLTLIVINPQDVEKIDYPQSDFFPSINATYNINRTNLLRLAYGKSINRQEFREVSPSSYYDFDLFSFVRGNKELKHAYIQNFDLRYEIYPASGEMISFALFYKKFTNPIEWTFRDGGDTRTFMFENAERADNYGAELDIKKSLGFIGMPDFSLSFNGALIRSEVKFGETSLDHDRPMQGQSPFLVNTGLFYQRDKLNMGLMYNVIGKRIVGIGRSDSAQGGSIDNDIPDMYEMARHVVDMSVSYRFGTRIELSAGIRDILAAPIVYKQFPNFKDEKENILQREQITREYKPGRNISLTLRLNL